MSENEVRIRNNVDADGNPAGGRFSAIGLNGHFQDGPLGRGDERRTPNGCFVEDLLVVVEARLKFYQGTRFNCVENGEALRHVETALAFLRKRTERREKQGVEGVNEVHKSED